MNPTGEKRRKRPPAFGEAPDDKISSLADEQLKTLLDKQLSKNISLEKHLTNKKPFLDPVLLKDETSSRAGVKSLEEFVKVSEEEERLVVLRSYGLTEAEVQLKIKYEGRSIDSDKADSDAIRVRLKDIEEKITKRQQTRDEPDVLGSAVLLSRKEYEAERSLLRGTEKEKELQYFVRQSRQEYPENDPVLATLKEFEVRSTRKTSPCRPNVDTPIEDEEDVEEGFIGPELANVNLRVVYIDEAEIIANRWSVERIRRVERFQNYNPGAESKVLYVKNLPKSISDKDLASIFGRFCTTDSKDDVIYRLMKGRMRGQAFVTFKDCDTAKRALQLCNGYVLKEKPLIIEYGKAGS